MTTRPTITAGELVAALSQFPPDKPVTIDVQGCDLRNADGIPEWLNIDGLLLPNEGRDDESPSILLIARDDFHIFQF